MIVAIHQPNFFPWLGYLGKIRRCDAFVFLDDAQFPRTSRGCWTNRATLLVGGAPRWITCPIIRATAAGPILDVEIDDSQPWRRRLLRSLESDYRRHPHSVATMDWVADILARPTRRLAEWNAETIIDLCRRLEINVRFALASQLSDPTATALAGSERLAALTARLEGTVYLAGDGADEYEDPAAYHRRGIELARNGFRREPYPQTGQSAFQPGLSALDALFNVGFDGVREMLERHAAAHSR